MDLKKYQKSYFDVIEQRYSCRSFTADKITTEELEALLKAASLAPTAVNAQPQKIYVVENPTLLEKMKEATKYLFDAKTVIVVCHNPKESWHRKYDNKDHGEIDSTIVATHILLAATAMNLGSCYVCSFKEDILKFILDIPQEYVVNCIIPIGYPKNIGVHGPRKEFDETIIMK